jgi:hypothetical protein
VKKQGDPAQRCAWRCGPQQRSCARATLQKARPGQLQRQSRRTCWRKHTCRIRRSKDIGKSRRASSCKRRQQLRSPHAELHLTARQSGAQIIDIAIPILKKANRTPGKDTDCRQQYVRARRQECLIASGPLAVRRQRNITTPVTRDTVFVQTSRLSSDCRRCGDSNAYCWNRVTAHSRRPPVRRLGLVATGHGAWLPDSY